MNKKIFALFICTAMLMIIRTAWGAGYEFEGVGARAVSRGGAVIADSTDWTAMYWNPGNIARATQGGKKDIGFEIFGGEAYGRDSNSLSNLIGPIFTKETSNSPFILGAVGGAIPLNDKFSLGFGLYTPILQGSNFNDTSNLSSPAIILDTKGSLGIVTGTLSAAYRITDRFSFGAGVDVLYGKIKSKTTIDNYPPGVPGGNTISSSLDGDGVGLEGIFGIAYQAKPNVALGMVYRTGSNINVRGRATADNTSGFLGDEQTNFRYELRHPATWGLGSVWRPKDKLALSFDINRTFWHRFSNAFLYDQPGTFLADTPNTFHWRDSWKLRLGTEYKLSDTNSFMAGYAYDWPALDKDSIDLSTAIDTYMNRLSLGWGHQLSGKTELVLGVLGGYGTRQEGNVHYRLSGWQAMMEFHFST